jgi:ABC-type nitrate/sulfonate/bicarbonate transport system substrate-binding protein
MPSKRLASFLCILILALLFAFNLSGCVAQQSAAVTIPIRIGWQVPWATQGQITQVLAHTNILELHGLQGEFKGFSYGAPLNEAALAGEVDVIFTADQPAITLLAADEEWVIIGRLMYNRVAIYVPPASPILTLEELRDKTIAIPFGAAAQRDAMKAIQQAGLDPVTDIHSIYLDIYEQSGIVQAGSAESWGEIDAMVGFDPTPAIFEHNNQARMLHVGKVVSLIVMSKAFIAQHPQAPERFLEAFREAYLYYALHQSQANGWFVEASQLTFDSVVLDLAASVEPNILAQTLDDVRITLTAEDMTILLEAAQFLLDQELISKPVDVSKYVDMTYAEDLAKSVLAESYDVSRVQVIQP